MVKGLGCLTSIRHGLLTIQPAQSSHFIIIIIIIIFFFFFFFFFFFSPY